jgi:hypothetical protein
VKSRMQLKEREADDLRRERDKVREEKNDILI